MSPSDQARVTISVAAPPELASDVFTTEIDSWWRRGLKYRHFSGERALIAIEPREGGRVFETLGGQGPAHVIGRVLVWQPPRRLRVEWRLSNFEPHERTEVEVVFEADGAGTRVTVTHRGWDTLRPDHPARHGETSAVFLGRVGLWWGSQLSAYRLLAGNFRSTPD
jgi:uncharacterized protein YndB with AHSA1/START domain